MPQILLDKNAYLFCTQRPEQYMKVPRAQQLDSQHIVTPFNDESMLAVEAIRPNLLHGYEPILYKYDWPKISGKYTPMQHQKAGAAFFTRHRRCFNLSEMATGKTATAIWASDYLLKVGQIKTVCILTTLSTVESVWREELFNIVPSKPVAVLTGAKKERIALLNYNIEYFIINHDGMKIDAVNAMLASKNFDLLIVDEGSKFSDKSTNRYKKLLKIIHSKSRIWWMTGTPCPQSPVQAWAQAALINPTFKNEYPFLSNWRDSVLKLVVDREGFRKYVVAEGANEKVFKALQPAFRVAKKDVLDLPPVVYTYRECNLSEEQSVAVKKLKSQNKFVKDGVKITAVNAGVELMKLRQIFCGLVKGIEEDSKDVVTVEFDASSRLELLCEVVKEAKSKCIVFVPFTAALHRVAEHIENVCGYTVEVINGEVIGAKRNEIIRNFSSTDNPEILVANPETAAHGLNLIKADTIIWFAPIYSADTYIQANERINRPGQKLSMRIVHLYSSKVEKKLYQDLTDKVDTHNNILDLYRTFLEEP